MDRSRVNALRNRAAALIDYIPTVEALIATLTAEPLPARVSTQIGITDGAESVHVIDPTMITWPPGMFVRAECTDALESLQKFLNLIAPLGQLYRASEKAGSLFGSLFSSAAHNAAAQAAAEELELRLTDPAISELETVAKDALHRAQLANNLQLRGVHLNPGVHGLPDTYISAARNALVAELGLENTVGIGFDTLDRNYVYPTFMLVQRIIHDPLAQPQLTEEARRQLHQLQSERAELLMRELPVDHLKTVTNDRLRTTGLAEIGISTVHDVLHTPITTLTQVSGIGLQTANRLKAAAQTLLSEAQAADTATIGTEASPAAKNLVGVLKVFELTDTLTIDQKNRRERLIRYFAEFPENMNPAGTALVVVKAGENCYGQFLDDIAWAVAAPESLITQATSVPVGADTLATARQLSEEAWVDYLSRPAHYQSLLDTLLEKSAAATNLAGLDESTIEAIRALQLNDELLHDLYLRGYQSFGAKFTLVRKKTILGDEMGLGKTVQALAAAAHLSATQPAARIAVVVPASLIVNWSREITKFTNIPVHIGHGEAKEAAVSSWAETGGFLIVTYDGARSMDIAAPEMVIVDEAHFVKNPGALRSKAVAKLIEEADYALLMTGTPMENRLKEFRQLVRYVQPELLSDSPEDSAERPAQFRVRVAPAYLRRNQQDVLDELPEKVENLDWVTLSSADEKNYAAAITDSNWMRARRAAFQSQSPMCAKVERIREIVADAETENKNVLIFSYFRDVLERLQEEFATKSVGVINGDVPPAQRQLLVDDLGVSGSVLLAQIGAGGVGLNIQKAQIVVLAEVQVKPSLEDQAIARAHRMGQTEIVHVHRIIGDDTVDERLLEITKEKRQLFDQYARESEAADVHDAVDVSEAQLAANIIAAERKRLGITDDTGTNSAEDTTESEASEPATVSTTPAQEPDSTNDSNRPIQ